MTKKKAPANKPAAWHAVGRLTWEAGKLKATWIEADPNARYTYDRDTGQYGREPGPYYDARETEDVRCAMRWRSRQAAAKWLQHGQHKHHHNLPDAGYQVLNLQQLALTAEHLVTVADTTTKPARKVTKS
jgi:hypothetical protein